MKPLSPVFAELARRYRRRHAGRTGQGGRAVNEDLESLLQSAGCADGDARDLAERELKAAEQAGVLERVPHHRRDPGNISGIRLMPENEAAFFRFLGETSPSARREALAAQFSGARVAAVPELWRKRWTDLLEKYRKAALDGAAIEPFDRTAGRSNGELLALLPRILAWEGESLIRFASCVLCGDSKRLEQLTGKLERLLTELTEGEVRTLDDLGIVPNPRSALIHGPLRLRLDGEWLDLGRLTGAVRLSQSDIVRAEALETTARRCLTVENETTFHELAKLGSGELLIQTSFPGSGTLTLLCRLPDTLEFHHFGDSDEAGFEILRVLGEQTGRIIHPLHMERGRPIFEQESLGRPTRNVWPFYEIRQGTP